MESEVNNITREFLNLGHGYQIPLITDVHPDDEMYLFFTTHPLHSQSPLESYFISGNGMIDGVREILQKSGKTLEDVDSFLEFACGYGRFTRHLIRNLDHKKITVSDVYKNAVDFQKRTFHVDGFYSEFNPEDLEIPSKYEVIYVASLFSHLPRRNWRLWLRKLFNALKEDGVLVFSTHGPSCMPAPTMMSRSGFCYLHMSESKHHSFDEYGTTYVTSEFVNKAVERETGESVLLEVPKGLWSYQDVYVVKRQKVSESENEYCTLGIIDDMSQDYEKLESDYAKLESDYARLEDDSNILKRDWQVLNEKLCSLRFLLSRLIGEIKTRMSSMFSK